MSQIDPYPPGTFCWVDLATHETDAARAFYTGLFGWAAVDLPTDQGVPYTMLRQDGADICALYPLPPNMGGRSSWNAYVAVADVDASLASAIDLGAQVLMPAMDVMKAGRMAVVQDPTGAALSLWQGREHKGAGGNNRPGAMCWVELQTEDMALAAQFYGDLFGWTTRTSESVKDRRYELFVHGEHEVGGMLEIAPDWGPVPPNWAVYFCVEDCDATLAEARRFGGKALVPAMEIANVGRFAFLQDPQGAVFAVIQLAHPG